MKKVMLICFVVINNLLMANSVPEINNIDIEWNNNDSKIYINYDLSDADDDYADVYLLVSTNGGEKFNYCADLDLSCSGDIGGDVTCGSGRQIVVQYLSIPDEYNLVFKIIADDKYELSDCGSAESIESEPLQGIMQNIIGQRYLDEQHKIEVREYIAGEFEEYGLEVSTQEFDYYYENHDINFKNVNIIGTIQSALGSGRYLILCAHYDSVEGTPGADDNGSGVTGLIAAAKALSEYNFNYGIKFIAFDSEELGMVGSEYFTDQLKDNDSIIAVINFDMIGYYTEEPNTQEVPEGAEIILPEYVEEIKNNDYKGDFIFCVANGESEFIAETFAEASDNCAPQLKYMSAAVPAIAESYFSGSDHSSFWDYDIPAVHLGDGGSTRNPNMHEASDIDVNYNFMANVVKSTVSCLSAFAEIRHLGIGYSTLPTNVNDMAGSTFRIYPNPVSEYLMIEYPEQEGINTVEVFSIEGIKVKELPCTSQVDVSGLMPGVYYLKIGDNISRFVKI